MSTIIIHGDIAANAITENNSDVISRAELAELGISGGGGSSIAIATKTADYTIQSTDGIILANGKITITVPLASSNPSKVFYIKRISTSGPVSIVSSGSDKMDGNTIVQLTAQYATISLISDGNSWWIF